MATPRKKRKLDDAVLDDIVRGIVHILAEVRRRQHALTKKHGVSMLQSTAIHALRRGDPMNITQLADALHLNQSTVSSLVDRMERDGLVRRLQSTRDRRSVKLRLTDRADEIAEGLPVSPVDFFKRLLMTLSPEEAQIAATLLGKMEKAMFAAFDDLDARASRKSNVRAS
jgi:DNA-binding MarR family transcriptional regulator